MKIVVANCKSHARKALKKALKLCYLCGEHGADSKDHIPPRRWFPKQVSGQLITVPAHTSCNNALSQDDDLLGQLVIAASKRTAAGRKAWDECVIPSWSKDPGAQKRLQERLTGAWVPDPEEGVRVRQEGLLLDHALLERQVRRFVRGLYYDCYRRPFPHSDSEIEVEKLHPPEQSIPPYEDAFAEQGLTLPWNHVEPGIFSYALIVGLKTITCLFVFFDTEVYRASVRSSEVSMGETGDGGAGVEGSNEPTEGIHASGHFGSRPIESRRDPMSAFSIRTFRDYADRLTEIVEWLESFGYRVSSTRIDRYKRTLEQLANAHEEGRLSSLLEDNPDDELDHYFMESKQLILVHRALAGKEQDGFRGKLKDLLKGPDFYTDEKPSSASNRARDIEFELIVASRLILNGVKVDLTTKADVVARIAHRWVFIECKRPQSTQAIRTSVKGGMGQLKKRYADLKRPTKGRGVVLVSLTKCMSPGNSRVVVGQRAEIDNALHAPTRAVFREHAEDLLRTDDTRTLAIVIMRSAAVHVLSENMITVSDLFVMNSTYDLADDDNRVLKKLKNGLYLKTE